MALTRIGILPDTHRPFHDKKAWEVFLTAMHGWKPEILVCLGDLGDNLALSRFSKNPKRPYTFEEEVADVNVALDELDEIGAKRKIFLEGNHEYRLIRYLQDKAPELFGMTDTPKLYKLGLRGWEHNPYKTDVRIGKLWLTHDAGSAGRYASFRMADLYQSSVACAHTHHMGSVVEGDARGTPFIVAQMGWLGDANQVDYAYQIRARRFWKLGFGTGLMNTETGIVQLATHPIIKNSVIVGEEEYRL